MGIKLENSISHSSASLSVLRDREAKLQDELDKANREHKEEVKALKAKASEAKAALEEDLEVARSIARDLAAKLEAQRKEGEEALAESAKRTKEAEKKAAAAAKTAEEKQHHKLDLKEKLHTVQVILGHSPISLSSSPSGSHC